VKITLERSHHLHGEERSTIKRLYSLGIAPTGLTRWAFNFHVLLRHTSCSRYSEMTAGLDEWRFLVAEQRECDLSNPIQNPDVIPSTMYDWNRISGWDCKSCDHWCAFKGVFTSRGKANDDWDSGETQELIARRRSMKMYEPFNAMPWLKIVPSPMGPTGERKGDSHTMVTPSTWVERKALPNYHVRGLNLYVNYDNTQYTAQQWLINSYYKDVPIHIVQME